MKENEIQFMRDRVVNWYAAALQAVDARAAMIRYLQKNPLKNQRYWLVAIGKAAAMMAAGLWHTSAAVIERGLLITPVGACATWSNPPPCIEWLESAHPIPDERSLYAGKRLLEFIQEAAADIHFVFLISGGTSALVEVLPPGVGLADLQRINQWLVANAIPIDQMNRIRKAVSQIKGGRLQAFVLPHTVQQYLVSDVPGDHLADIGSGLLITDETDRCLSTNVPDWMQSLLARVPALSNMPSTAGEIQSVLIASNFQARAEVERLALQTGTTIRCNEEIGGDAITAGRDISQRIVAGEPGAYIFGGETVVTLPLVPGRGGRCQSLALAAAQHLAGHTDIVLLAASTDGSDGSSGIAGAMVDGGTCARGRIEGLDVAAALQQADAGAYLETTGDLLDTGPTGTNVMDLVIALKVKT